MIECHYYIVISEPDDLVEPDRGISSNAMRKNEGFLRFGIAVDLVIYIDTITGYYGHSLFLIHILPGGSARLMSVSPRSLLT